MLMKKVKLFMACILSFLSVSLWAQNLTLNGVVTDSSNGDPVPGAAVVVKGSANAYALTNEKGAFSLFVEKGNILVISSLGY